MAVQTENMCFEATGFGSFATQEWCMASGDGSCLQELQQLQPLVDSDNALVSSCVGSLPVEIAQSLSSDLEKQRKELDWFLQWENKRLRRSIMQESRRQQAIILQKYESIIRGLMHQKNEELAVARNRGRELQDLFTATEMEARAWEKTAREKEVIVTDLSNKLNHARENGYPFPSPYATQEDDAVSFCGSSSGEGREEGLQKQNQRVTMACKLCQARSLCVVFFPCRHLCCCKFCESLLGYCPVCHTVKEASLEVSLG